MIDWQAARAFTETACAETFDYTDCILIPMSSGLTVNHKPGPDPDRAPFPFVGSIDLDPPSDRISRHLSNDPGSKGNTVSYDAVLSAHVGTWPYLPRRGDHVQSGTNTYKIAASEQDGASRPAWYLTRV